MAEVLRKFVACPKCGRTSVTDITLRGNTREDPTLREDIFSEKLFRWKCSLCGYGGMYRHPLLYDDIDRGFMVYYIPLVERRVLVDAALEKEYAALKGIARRVVPTVNAMMEKITLFELGLDDRAVELTKFAAADVVAKDTGHAVSEGYFSSVDAETSVITFQFFIGADKRPFFQSTSLENYERSAAIVEKYFLEEKQQPGFFQIGREWARTALAYYRTRPG